MKKFVRLSRSPLERVIVSLGTALLDAGRGKTLTKSFVLDGLGLSLSDKQIPQAVENLESGRKPREAWETVVVLVRQAL